MLAQQLTTNDRVDRCQHPVFRQSRLSQSIDCTWRSWLETVSISYIQQLRAVSRTLSTNAAKTHVHALIFRRVDYCNSVARVQFVCVRSRQCSMEQHDSSSECASIYDHITNTMRHDLHWLSVRQRIKYKLCTLVSKCLRRTAPSYLADMYIPVSFTAGRQHLRSAVHHDLTIPRSRLARYGSRSFVTTAPSICNSLPLTIRNSILTFAGFCSRLKVERIADRRVVE